MTLYKNTRSFSSMTPFRDVGLTVLSVGDVLDVGPRVNLYTENTYWPHKKIWSCIRWGIAKLLSSLPHIKKCQSI